MIWAPRRLGLLLTAVAAILVLIDGSFAHAWGSLGSPSSGLASPVGTATTTLATINGDAFNQPTEAGLADTGPPGPDRSEAKGEVEGVAPSGAFSAPEATTAIRRVGDYLESVDDVIANPRLLSGGRTPAEVDLIIGRTPGWRVEGLGQGSREGQGWLLREYTSRGHATGRQIRWHPGGGHHGPDPYWRVIGYNERSGIIR